MVAWQSRVRPNRSARTSADNELADMEEIALSPANLYQAAGGASGLLYTGSALASGQQPNELALVDSFALLAFPSEASPQTPFVRTMGAAGSFMLGLDQPTGLMVGRRSVFRLLVTNTSGSAITLYLADGAPNRVPLYYHGDHAAARPTIAAGATDLVEVTYLPSPERAIVRLVPVATTFRARRPVLAGTAMPAPAADATIAGQLAGDLLVSWDFRNAATNQAAVRTGFTVLQSLGVAAEYALRVAYRVATADGETIEFPASNAPTRSLIQCWRGVDGASPIIGSAQASGTGIPGTMPAVAATEPGFSIVGMCGRQLSGALNWLLPSGYVNAGENSAASATLIRTGSRPDLIGMPAVAFTTPGNTQAWGGVGILLRGAAL